MAAKVKDYYGVLGLKYNASEEAIKQAYSIVAGANGDTKEVKEAYRVLITPELRVQYDNYYKEHNPHQAEIDTVEVIPSKSQKPQSTQLWQYMTLESQYNYGTTKYYIDGDMQSDLKNEQFSVVINILGSEGWELVGIATQGEAKTFVFKRPTSQKYTPPKKGSAA